MVLPGTRCLCAVPSHVAPVVPTDIAIIPRVAPPDVRLLDAQTRIRGRRLCRKPAGAAAPDRRTGEAIRGKCRDAHDGSLVFRLSRQPPARAGAHRPACRPTSMPASGSAPAITPVNGRTSTAARKLCMGKPSRAERAAPAADELVAATQPGLIISNYGATLQVEDANGLIHRCTVRKKVDALVCGDRVRWQTSASDEGVIVALEQRRSLLVRPDPRGQLKPMAANVDQEIVMTAPRRPQANENDQPAASHKQNDPHVNDRYLVAAALCGIGALLVVNKMDIFTTAGRAEAEQLAHMYRAVGYRVLFTAAKLGMDLEPLLAALRNKTSVISGQYGVGERDK